jgi:tRNA(fMet)-specific endonuclease VapC
LRVYLPDTNIISLLIRRHPPVDSRFRAERRARSRFILCPVAEYETRRGLIRKKATAVQARFEEIIERFAYTEFQRNTWNRASGLWAFSRDVGMPLPDADILVAAQALELDAVVVTDNESHFRVFEPLGLKVENWTKPEE